MMKQALVMLQMGDFDAGSLENAVYMDHAYFWRFMSVVSTV